MADPTIKKMIQPGFDLNAPGTYMYTGAASSRGLKLNRFALSLRSPIARKHFLSNEASYLARFDLGEEIVHMVRTRDWTGMLRAGGHVQAILKLAATVGQSLFDIGAHNAEVDTVTLVANCPRYVSGIERIDG
jgi:protocatechuate 4,5-dioxygenase alpha chain